MDFHFSIFQILLTEKSDQISLSHIVKDRVDALSLSTSPFLGLSKDRATLISTCKRAAPECKPFLCAESLFAFPKLELT